jgi:hypothetical protein
MLAGISPPLLLLADPNRAATSTPRPKFSTPCQGHYGWMRRRPLTRTAAIDEAESAVLSAMYSQASAIALSSSSG